MSQSTLNSNLFNKTNIIVEMPKTSLEYSLNKTAKSANERKSVTLLSILVHSKRLV